MWYSQFMSTTAENKIPRTIMMPVTTMEEMPLLSEAERAEMLTSLKEAEARMGAGEGIEHDPDTFVERLMAVRAAALAKKSA